MPDGWCDTGYSTGQFCNVATGHCKKPPANMSDEEIYF